MDVKKYIANLEITPAVKKKDLGKVIAEVFNRYSVDQTAEILDQINPWDLNIRQLRVLQYL